MTIACSCEDLTLGNLGLPNCTEINKVAKRLFIMPAYANDGTRNGITLSDTLDAAYIADKVNQYLAAGTRNPLDQRWYPSPLIENVEDLRDDPTYFEYGSGKKSLTREGVRHFKAMIDRPAFEMLQKVNKNACTQLAVFIIDADGNAIGNGGIDSDFLYGILIDMETWHGRLIKPTDDAPQMIELMFDFHRLEKDEDLKMLLASDFANVDLLTTRASYDVYGVISNETTTSLDIQLTTSYGSAKSAIAVPGLVAGDFELYNKTDSASVAVASAVESSTVPGLYTLTFAAQTSADELQVLIKKGGLDGTAVEALTATIP